MLGQASGQPAADHLQARLDDAIIRFGRRKFLAERERSFVRSISRRSATSVPCSRCASTSPLPVACQAWHQLPRDGTVEATTVGVWPLRFNPEAARRWVARRAPGRWGCGRTAPLPRLLHRGHRRQSPSEEAEESDVLGCGLCRNPAAPGRWRYSAAALTTSSDH
jgi:hypothetical protein